MYLVNRNPRSELTHPKLLLYVSGARVYLACRSMERGEAAAEHIRIRTGTPSENSPVLQLDLSSLKSVNNFVYEFKRRKY